MDRKRRLWFVPGCIAWVAAMSLIGCGGDSEADAPTKAAFVKQGNAICAEWQQERSAVFSEFNAKFGGKDVTKADQKEGVLELLEPYEDAVRKLGQLTPPDGDEDKVDTIVVAMEEGAEKIQARPLTALTSNTSFEKANELSNAYGLKECGF